MMVVVVVGLMGEECDKGWGLQLLHVPIVTTPYGHRRVKPCPTYQNVMGIRILLVMSHCITINSYQVLWNQQKICVKPPSNHGLIWMNSPVHHPGGTLTSARPVSARWPLPCANGCWGQHDASWKGDKKVTFWGVQLGSMLVTPAVWDVPSGNLT